MNRMKKFMALLLAVVLIAQTGFAASAQENTPSVPSVQSETSTETEPQDETDAEKQEEQQPEDSKDETAGETPETEQEEEETAGEADGEQPGAPSEETETEEDGQTPTNQEQAQDQGENQGQEQQIPAESVGDEEEAETDESAEKENAEEMKAANALLEEETELLADYIMSDGVNIIKTGYTDQTFNIGEGQVVMISGQGAEEPIVFNNCIFNLSGGTVKISRDQDGISYNNGEVVTKLWIGGDVEFNNCRFVTAEGATKTTSAGYDAAIYFYSGNINLKGCTLSAKGYNGQFLGLYGSSGAVTFNDSDISTVGNKNGWSYAMYGGSVLKLVNGSSMTATGMSIDSGNTNAFYSGDNKTGYDAIFIEDSTVDFSDNQAGGFAINNVNIVYNNSDYLKKARKYGQITG